MFQVSDTPDDEVIDVISIQSQVVYEAASATALQGPRYVATSCKLVAVPIVLLSDRPVALRWLLRWRDPTGLV